MALLLAEGAPVHGIVYRGTRYDTGMPLGYLQAVVQLAASATTSGRRSGSGWPSSSTEDCAVTADMTAPTADAEAAAATS